MHSLNHQVYQHLFKITIPHYKRSFLRHRTPGPGGPAGAVDKKDGEVRRGGARRAGSGKARRALSSPAPPDKISAYGKLQIQLTWLRWDGNLRGGDTLQRGHLTCQRAAASLLFGIRSPSPAFDVSLMARQANSELAVLIRSVGKEKVSLYCNSQLGAFLNHQMLFQCSADIFDFLSLIFV